ncbi:MAG: LamG-like jellyroll fold domain-containing protein [Pirellulaceae bacterium]
MLSTRRTPLCVSGMRMFVVLAIVACSMLAVARGDDADRIRPYEANPRYWQYKGQPVLLLGGSWQDNLFNHPKGLEQHLDLLKSVGGNYVRNVMSHRNVGNVFAYKQVDGQFDLDQWNGEYWRRFENFLRLTHERDIIVQIEIWATWDHYEDHQSLGGWSKHPFNPANNMTYTAEESGLPTVVDYPPRAVPTDHPFFSSVPALDDNKPLLKHQTAYVDKLLSYSLEYPHVLYCMNNETGEDVAWSDFWARYVRTRAAEAGKRVETAEMRRSGNITTPDHQHMVDNPDLYTFLDISQNNTQRGQGHWNRIQQARALVEDHPRPLNNTKIYTFDPEHDVALERWWRNVLGGCASARFHRPHPLEGEGDHEKHTNVGLGLSPLAQAHIRGARVLMEQMGWPAVKPDLRFVELVADQPLAVRTEKTHVAYTRGADGQARVYLNGKEATRAESGGDLSAWDAQLRLALGDEFVGDRGWLGTYHDVAIYNRALGASEIADHYTRGEPEHLEGLQVRYAFDEGEGTVVRDVSGRKPALDLHVQDTEAVTWLDGGLEVHDATLIATRKPARRLTSAVRESNAFSLEAWIAPATKAQAGPARIVTLSRDHGTRNFTLGQDEDAYEMRLRTTATSANGLPALKTGGDAEPSLAAVRSPDRDRAAIFVTHGSLLNVDMDPLQEGLQARWFDPRTAELRQAARRQDGYFQPPSKEIWVLTLQ